MFVMIENDLQGAAVVEIIRHVVTVDLEVEAIVVIVVDLDHPVGALTVRSQVEVGVIAPMHHQRGGRGVEVCPPVAVQAEVAVGRMIHEVRQVL